jgi:hypothetical protein
MIGRGLSNNVAALAIKGFGHAIHKNHCDIGVGSRDRWFNICG